MASICTILLPILKLECIGVVGRGGELDVTMSAIVKQLIDKVK